MVFAATPFLLYGFIPSLVIIGFVCVYLSRVMSTNERERYGLLIGTGIGAVIGPLALAVSAVFVNFGGFPEIDPYIVLAVASALGVGLAACIFLAARPQSSDNSKP